VLRGSDERRLVSIGLERLGASSQPPRYRPPGHAAVRPDASRNDVDGDGAGHLSGSWGGPARLAGRQRWLRRVFEGARDNAARLRGQP